MSSPNDTTESSLYCDADRATLLDVARQAIAQYLTHHRTLPIDVVCYSPALQQRRASFVTLKIDDDLRGCIGTLIARRALVADVAENAVSAAFRDPRFSPLSPSELEQLDIHISVLSPPQPMAVTSEQDLLDQMRPGVDGLVLEDGRRRGTFLPAVWEDLPDPKLFLRHLKLKAGMAPDEWPASLVVSRYTCQSIH